MNSSAQSALVGRAKRGDRDAFGLLWDDTTPKLFGYLVNVLRDRVLAEDILQTTGLKAIGALRQFEERDSTFSSWLFAIAKNECRQHWRTIGRETPLDPDIHDQPTDGREKADNNLLVERALRLLSEDDRELLRLYYIADLPVRDIARLTKRNPIAVRVRMHRALGHIRSNINTQ